MMKVLISGIKQGAMSAAAGLVVGLIVGLLANYLIEPLPDRATAIANGYLLMALGVPAMYYLNLLYNTDVTTELPFVQQKIMSVSVIAWLLGTLLGTAFYMMPATMIPIMLSGGAVTIETSDVWYNDVFTQILGWRVLVVALGAAIGFYLVAGNVGQTE